jgi:endonuclease III
MPDLTVIDGGGKVQPAPMDTWQAAQVFLRYLDSLESFVFLDYYDGNYHHMGATISDSILQAGLTYESVVRPRIKQIRANYPDAKTTSAFLKILREVGAKVVLAWTDDEKPNRIIGLTEFFVKQGIETEQDLRAWLAVETNQSALLLVRGIGQKTADYLKILVGAKTTAVDRHIFAILSEAGIPTDDYDKAREIVNAAADLRGIDRSCFDHSIWQFMSGRCRGRRSA